MQSFCDIIWCQSIKENSAVSSQHWFPLKYPSLQCTQYLQVRCATLTAQTCELIVRPGTLVLWVLPPEMHHSSKPSSWKSHHSSAPGLPSNVLPPDKPKTCQSLMSHHLREIYPSSYLSSLSPLLFKQHTYSFQSFSLDFISCKDP